MTDKPRNGDPHRVAEAEALRLALREATETLNQTNRGISRITGEIVNQVRGAVLLALVALVVSAAACGLALR